MKFTKLVDEYMWSPHFAGLAPKSKQMYNIYMGDLQVIGKSVPVVDADMPIPVAVARSRSHVDAKSQGTKDVVCRNLSQFWRHAIDNYEKPNKEGVLVNISNSTKNTLLTYLGIVYKWGVGEGYLNVAQNPVVNIKRWAHNPEPGNPLTEDNVVAIEHSLKRKDYPEDLKPYAYLWIFLYDGGMRPWVEAAPHEREWFEVKGQFTLMQIRKSKGKESGKLTRYVLLTKRMLRCLAWFDNQPKALGHEKYTFRTNNGRMFLSQVAGEKMKEVAKLAGFEPREVYDSRRGLATTLYKEVQQGSRSFSEVKDRLGHIHAKTTEGYIGLSSAERGAGYRAPVNSDVEAPQEA